MTWRKLSRGQESVGPAASSNMWYYRHLFWVITTQEGLWDTMIAVADHATTQRAAGSGCRSINGPLILKIDSATLAFFKIVIELWVYFLNSTCDIRSFKEAKRSMNK